MATSITLNNVFYNIFNDTSVYASDGSNKTLMIANIEATVLIDNNSFSVIGIASDGFNGCTLLTSVVIPNSVTSIGDSSFFGCTSLNSVDIPDSVTSIGNRSFFGCTSLTSVIIPNGVTIIRDSSFFGCTSLTSVDIPDSVTSIDASCFESCTSLTSIVIPNGIRYINGSRCFFGCTSLTSVIFSNNFTDIYSNSCFESCTSLASVTFSIILRTLGNRSFFGCTSLTSITIPSTVQNIGGYAFGNCTNLTSVIILAGYAYTNYTSFTDVKIASGSSITFYNYNNYSDLSSEWQNISTYYESIIFPTTNEIIVKKYINGITYRLTKSNKTAVVNMVNGVTTSSLICLDTVDHNGDTYTVTSISTYDSVNGANLVIDTVRLPKNLTTIEFAAFFNYKLKYTCDENGLNKLRILDFPTSLKNIADSAFAGPIDFDKVTLNDGLLTIGNYVFSGANINDGQLTIPESVKSIGYQAFFKSPFSNPEGFTKPGVIQLVVNNPLNVSVQLNSFTNLSDYFDKMYYQGSSITFGTVSSYDELNYNWKTISKYYESIIFIKLTDIVVIENIAYKKISGGYVNAIDSSNKTLTTATIRTTVTINNVLLSVTSIADDGFNGCASLTSVTIPDSITSIGSRGFVDCVLLTSVTIPTSVTTIGESVFLNCPNLKTVNILNPLTSSFLQGPDIDPASTFTDLRYTENYTGSSITFGTVTSYNEIPENWKTISQYYETVTPAYRAPLVCFKEDSKILTSSGYKLVQELNKGDLVKTLKNGYKQVVMIGKKEIYHAAYKERIKDQLYICSSDRYPELFEDLIITGCHSLLVDNFINEEKKETVYKLHNKFYATDGKYRIPAYLDDKTDIYSISGSYMIYHIALENENYTGNYGIFANGLLVESCSKRYLKELSNMELN